MLFNSFKFAVFLPIVFGLYWVVPKKFKWIILFVFSYYFYMSWNAKYVILILFTTFISYLSAIFLEKYRNPNAKKAIVALTSVASLGVLFVFKYFNFFSDSINSFFSAVSINLQPITLKLLLPIGISFYTFQTLSYVIDVYRGTTKAEHHFGIYATFISFFPQLVAGPIERTTNLLPQIKNTEHHFDYDNASYGLKLMAWGYFKKLAIADVVAVYVNDVYGAIDSYAGIDILLAMLFFTIQIYCDFSGYSDIAIGTAKLFDINLTDNFRSPYFSLSVKEFWGRWHISLSTWFKDYVYIPLGGNRCSKSRHYLNLIITFAVSGLWHGANWTYIIWGLIHGVSQIFENIFLHKRSKVLNAPQRIIRYVLLFAFYNITWVFFRAETLKGSLYVFLRLFRSFLNPTEFFNSQLNMLPNELIIIIASIIILAVFDYYSKKINVINRVSALRPYLRWAIYLALIFFIIFRVPVQSSSEFIYFQF